LSDVAVLAAEQDPEEIMALDEAIRRFDKVEPRAAEVVELRFFAGHSVEETAEVTGLSVRTANREWSSLARGFTRNWGKSLWTTTTREAQTTSQAILVPFRTRKIQPNESLTAPVIFRQGSANRFSMQIAVAMLS
jgi:ECF sigma factor